MPGKVVPMLRVHRRKVEQVVGLVISDNDDELHVSKFYGKGDNLSK